MRILRSRLLKAYCEFPECLSMHTFTPVIKSKKRQADGGLLFDPTRNPEKRFCGTWKQVILYRIPEQADPVGWKNSGRA